MRNYVRLTRVLVSTSHALMIEYRSEIYLWVLSHVLPFIMMGLWGLETARYFLAVFIVRQFSVVWVVYDFEWQLVEGRLSNQLVRPLNPAWNFITAHLGEQVARFPFFVIILGVVLLLVPQARWWPHVDSIALGILAIYATFTLRFVMQYAIAMLTFWFERAGALDQLVYLPFLFLSGMVAPLSTFPPAVRQVVLWTPFPYFISFPARILTRDAAIDPISATEIIHGFGIMAGYTAIFWLLCAWLWKKGIAQYSGMGA
jgi:ABC-2 type transport system permease protein